MSPYETPFVNYRSLRQTNRPTFDIRLASHYTGLSPSMLAKLRRVGGGPRVLSYSRRAIRYRVSDLDAWMTARTFTNTSERAAA